MSNEELKYIFSESACLTPRQMKRYVRGSMTNEESYVLELHLNSCPFCNEAVEGLFEQREGNATEVVTHLNNNFLKDHFSLHQPKVHLNSMAPAHAHPHPVAHVQPRKRRKFRGESIWRPSGLAAALLIGIVVIWFAKQRQQLKTGQAANVSATVAEQTELSSTPSGKDRVLASAQLMEIKDEPMPLQVATVASTQPQTVPAPQPEAIVAQKDIKPAEPQKLPEPKAKTVAPKREEVVVAQYKAPVAERTQPQSPVANEAIEKAPERTSNSLATTSRAHSDDGDSGIADRRKDAETGLSADDLYNQGKYSAALKQYQQQMNQGGRGKRNYATLQAARCYLAMGNKQNAIQLLQSIVRGGGTHKRAAKRMLEDLGADKGD